MAQDEPVFHRISLEQGLSDSRVSSITQDKHGFMWFGTAAGLNRYDGYSIKVYEEGSGGLTANGISALYCSKAGRLYAGDGQGLLEYDYAADSFRRPRGTDSARLNTKGYQINLMAEDALRRIYLGCVREGFHRYDPRTGLIEDLNKVLSAPRIAHVSGLTFGKDGRLWITTQKQGFFVVNPANNTWQEIPQPIYKGILDTCCGAVHRTVFIDDDRLLLGQHSMGLIIYNTRTLSFTRHNGILGQNDSVRFNAVYRLIKDYRGRIWAGTAYFGLAQYLPATDDVIQYKYDPYNPSSYGGYRVSALYEDREHNIWVGTGGYGVCRFHPDKAVARYFPWYPLGDRTPPGPEVLSSGAHDSAAVWVGTDRGPALFDFHRGTFKSFRYESSYNPERPGSNINYIYRDRRGYVWMGSRSLGLSKYDPRSNTFYRYRKTGDAPYNDYGKHLRGELPGNVVRTVAEDPAGNLLLLIDHRIAIFDPATAVCRYHNTDTSLPLLRLKGVTDFLATPQGLVYSTDTGGVAQVFRYNFGTGASTLLAKLTGEDPRPTLNRLYVLRDGTLAAATTNGIFLIGKEGGIIRHHVWDGPGRKNRIVGLAQDAADERLWVCTDRHIGSLHLGTGHWRWLGAADGLKPTRFFGDAFRVLPNGRLLVGSSDGIFVVNTSQISTGAAAVRPPVLVDFSVSGKPFPLAAPLQDLREIRLKHNQNFFSFGMSTLSFGEGVATEYGYKLEGFDRDWQTAGPDRRGQYTGSTLR